jgi:NAD(P)-dependent dehydrogenase (short-subunit alcohol dehydrogenase family)
VELADKVVVVTGGARGIGRAMVHRFAKEKPRVIFVADRDLAPAQAVAREVGGIAVACDVGREEELRALIERAGEVDLFCSNAGIGTALGLEAPDEVWQRIWDVNVMQHVWAARALLPSAARPAGTSLVITASAAGLLSMIGDAPYSVTKHAAVGLAEWLSITYGASGMRVSCLCPLFVNTDLYRSALSDAGAGAITQGTLIEPEVVADSVVAAVKEERFLILPHPEVATFFAKKAADHEKWLAAMRKLQAKVDAPNAGDH